MALDVLPDVVPGRTSLGYYEKGLGGPAGIRVGVLQSERKAAAE